MFNTVLFPIDTSWQGRELAATALQLVRSHHKRLVLLSVLEQECPERHDRKAVALLLKHTQERMNEAGLLFEVVERKGNAALVIVDVANELNVDLIVMGTHGVNLNTDSESTAALVIQVAPCPVLVVP